VSEKTEEATPRRRSEARQKGQVAKSAEINSAAIVLVGFILIRSIGPFSYETLNSLMKRSFTSISSSEITLVSLQSGGLTITLTLAQIVGPFVVALLGVGLIANITQVGFLFSQEALKPDLNRINPVNGFNRLYSQPGIVELAKSSLKIIAIGYIVFITLRDSYFTVAATSQMLLSDGLTRLFSIGYIIGIRSATTMIFIAAIDFIFQRHAFNKSLRMSKQEIREEMKRYENPQLKALIRARQRQLAMYRMMSSVR
jgi:flagellar biosynthetic protein FlhB